jgi:hypothetical protein
MATTGGTLSLYGSVNSATVLTLGTKATGVVGSNFVVDGSNPADGGYKTANAAIITPAWGTRVTSAVNQKVYLKVLGVPTGGHLWVQTTAPGGVPVTGAANGGASWKQMNDTTNNRRLISSSNWTDASAAATSMSNSNDNVYFVADKPGTYTAEFFEDVDGSTDDSTGDNVSSTITITAETAASWAPTATAPTSLNEKVDLPVTIDLSGVTTADVRGTKAISTGLAALLGVAWTPTTTAISAGNTVGAANTLIGTASATRILAGYTGANAANITGAGSIASSLVFDSTGTAFGTDDVTLTPAAGLKTDITAPTTSITGITTSTLLPSVVSGSVAANGDILAATKSVAVVATGSAGSANAPVYFLVTPSRAGTSVNASGTLLATLANGARLYSVPLVVTATPTYTATLTITPSDTTTGAAYVVTAQPDAGTVATRTLTYKSSAAYGTVQVGNTDAELALTPATTAVVLKAGFVDEWGNTVAPSATLAPQATISVNGATAVAPTMDGNYLKYSYTPSTTPVAGSRTAFTWAYPGLTGVTGYINWASNTAANAVTLISPLDGATGVLIQSATSAPNAAQGGASTYGAASGAVTGTVADSSGNGIAFKKITLSAEDGVYFSTSASGAAALTKTIDVVTD